MVAFFSAFAASRFAFLFFACFGRHVSHLEYNSFVPGFVAKQRINNNFLQYEHGFSPSLTSFMFLSVLA